nr:phage integrase family [uncultured bacterium]AMP48404.1 phage integrase family [uncultured bacterium]
MEDAQHGVTLDEYAEGFLRRREETHRSWRDDRNRWNAHVKGTDFATMPMRAIQPRHVRTWLDGLLRTRALPGRGQGSTRLRLLSRQSIINAVNLVRVALEDAVERGALDSNPARGVRVPLRPQDRVTRETWTYLPPAEQSSLLEVVPPPERWLVEFAIGTGLRAGEQWCLERGDVHADSPHPHVVVRFGSPGLPPKNGRVRAVPLFGRALQAWREWDSAHPPTRRLAFPSLRGKRRDREPRHWHEWLAAAHVRGATGAGVCWHSLRHTAASNLVSGVLGRSWSLEEVCALLGHSSIQVTERYAHLMPAALTRAAVETQAAIDRPSAEVRQMSRRGQRKRSSK